jgi:hypothetical protein
MNSAACYQSTVDRIELDPEAVARYRTDVPA